MRITPRKGEVEAILDLLSNHLEIDQEDLESFMDLAEEILKRVADLFSERDWWACGLPVGSQTIAYGPLSSATEVKRFAEKLAVGGTAKGAKIYATSPPLRRLETSEPPKA